jgi:hypothetical protein
MDYMRREVRPAAERTSDGPLSFFITSVGDGVKVVQRGDRVMLAITYQATRKLEAPLTVVVNNEEQLRRNRVTKILSKLILETQILPLIQCSHLRKSGARKVFIIPGADTCMGPGPSILCCNLGQRPG